MRRAFLCFKQMLLEPTHRSPLPKFRMIRLCRPTPGEVPRLIVKTRGLAIIDGLCCCLPAIYFQHFDRSILERHHTVGVLLGLAIASELSTPLSLSRHTLLSILDMEPGVEDLAFIDPEYYRSLQFLLENEGAEEIGMTFSYDARVSDADHGILSYPLDEVCVFSRLHSR
jgi:hypothetical protein